MKVAELSAIVVICLLESFVDVLARQNDVNLIFSNATKFPHSGLHIAVKYPKAGPKKGTIKISPNKTLQSLFINVAASPKINVPVTSAIVYVLTIIRVTLRQEP